MKKTSTCLFLFLLGAALVLGSAHDLRAQPVAGDTLQSFQGVVILGPDTASPCQILAQPGDALQLRDPSGVRVLGPNNQGCRVFFGPTNDCSIEVDPFGPRGLQMRDPDGVRLLGRNLQGCRLTFGPTDDCMIEIDPFGPGGLLLRDPIGTRLLGRNNEGCRLFFGPTDDCSIQVDPTGPTGLILRDPAGARLLGLNDQGCRLTFGPTDDCIIEVDPSGPDGLLLRDPRGVRLLGQDLQGCRLLFGPTDDCVVEVDPRGPDGLLLRDPRGIRILNDNVADIPTLRFGETNDCNISASLKKGMVFSDPRGFTFEGMVFAQGFAQASSRRFKDNVRPIEGALDKIQKLQGVSFDWKAERGGAADIGLIAEDVEQVLPELVSRDDSEGAVQGVRYANVVAVTVEGIKAQQTQIEKLEAENAELREGMDSLVAQIKALAEQMKEIRGEVSTD